MKRIKCDEVFKRFESVPGTNLIEKTFPQYVKGWAFISPDGNVGYAETEAEAIEACEMMSKFFGISHFFLYSSWGHFKADWSIRGAVVVL